MFLHRDESLGASSRTSSLPVTTFLYLIVEVLIAIGINILLSALSIVVRILPSPPRDLTNERIVVTGAESRLGRALVDEFSTAGCVVASVHHESTPDTSEKELVTGLYDRIESISREDRKSDVSERRKIFSYECDPKRREQVFDVAERIRRDVERVDVLVICADDSNENFLDTVTFSLMSHYWTMLAFVPSMIRLSRAHIVAVWPTNSTRDAYTRSKAAIAGVVEAIGQQFSTSNQLTFTTIAPNAESRFTKQSEREIARDIVEVVRRNQRSLGGSWRSNLFYSIGYRMHGLISTFTDWLYQRGCNDDF